jgi:hypothetical protein
VTLAHREPLAGLEVQDAELGVREVPACQRQYSSLAIQAPAEAGTSILKGVVSHGKGVRAVTVSMTEMNYIQILYDANGLDHAK